MVMIRCAFRFFYGTRFPSAGRALYAFRRHRQCEVGQATQVCATPLTPVTEFRKRPYYRLRAVVFRSVFGAEYEDSPESSPHRMVSPSLNQRRVRTWL